MHLLVHMVPSPLCRYNHTILVGQVSQWRVFYSQALVVVRRNCGCWLFLHRRCGTILLPSPSCSCKNITIFSTAGLTPLCPTITLPPCPLKSNFSWEKSPAQSLENSGLVVDNVWMLVPSAKIWVWGHLISGSSSEAGVANNSHSMHEIQRARAMKYNLFQDRNTNAFPKEMSISPKEAVVLIGRWQRRAVEMICSPVAEEFDSGCLSAYISA